MDNSKMEELRIEALNSVDTAKTIEELNDVRNKYLSKKSEFMGLMNKMRELSSEEKVVFGQAFNRVRNEITESLDNKRKELEEEALNKRLNEESIDITLPGYNMMVGGRNPIYVVRDEIINIFLGMGYEVADGPEVELDYFNFELLNIPKDHPARDMQDTFYIDDNTLLRTHTSPVQARTMQEKKGKPIKIICPGKTYRRDDDDATHSHQFGQVEGLLIDKNVNLGHLKATLELFLRKMFGEKREIRLRSSYFPFTEPSVEVDVSCDCHGKEGCSKCHGTGWIEILGAGMVHPNVLNMSGYNSDEYQGFAFGIGLERVAMLRYGVDDIRRFYQNDIRFLKQFQKK